MGTMGHAEHSWELRFLAPPHCSFLTALLGSLAAASIGMLVGRLWVLEALGEVQPVASYSLGTMQPMAQCTHGTVQPWHSAAHGTMQPMAQ